MARWHGVRGRASDRGAAAVEFALVVPVLLMLVFGIINFGFIFAAQISLNSSARDASRVGVVKPLASTGTLPKTCSQIASWARAGATTLGLDKSKITIIVTGPGGTCTSPVAPGIDFGNTLNPMCTPVSGSTLTQITVQMQYIAVSPAPLVPPSSATLSAKGVFQCEYV